MQSDAVAIVTVGVGTPQIAPLIPTGPLRECLCEKARHPHEYFTHECVSGCQREVSTLVPLFVPRSGLICVPR